jgi:hypothetical protein
MPEQHRVRAVAQRIRREARDIAPLRLCLYRKM